VTVRSFARCLSSGRLRSSTLLIAGVALVLLWAAGNASASSYSSIVVDAETGKIVSQFEPDTPTYPASLTKMMTLYLVFDALEKGKVTLDQHFTVSEHASIQAPSKLDLQPGESIALRDLILAVVTHSANDAAVVLAEGLGGSEPGFAEIMTEKAHELGMTNTVFRNASGLPKPPNTTTARDLVTLARSLYQHFPKEYAYFSTEEFTFRGHSYSNHNHLMHAFEGMDGIKTGYINASGFNLAASAVRDGHRLIGVVMGGESAHSRDMRMAQLLNDGFARTGGSDVEVADADETPAPAASNLAHRAGRAIAALSPVGRAEASPASLGRFERRHVKTENEGWSIQVGAFSQHAAAETAAAQSLAKLPSARGRAVRVVVPSRAAKEHVFRARIVNFTEREAQTACRELHHKHKSCAVIAPEAI
jgi:D-alanyl-D-alanine carboxypeptidase